MKKHILFAAVVGLFTLSAFATEEVANPPDVDSCGLGWQVTKKKSLMGTCTRGTTNMFVPPSFGMTTGTIGCAKHPFAKADEQAFKYAMANYDVLKVEMAKGEGEFLAAFGQTLGCDAASAGVLGQMVRENYGSIVTSPASMVEGARAGIASDSLLSVTCGRSS